MIQRLLSTNTRIYTDMGSVFVKQLSNNMGEFFVLSYDPPLQRIKPKMARLMGTARGEIVHVRTQNGVYELSKRQALRTLEGVPTPVTELQTGQKLQSCDLDNVDGFIYLQTEQGPLPLHELLEAEMSGAFKLAMPERVRPKLCQIQEVIEVVDAGQAAVHAIEITCPTPDDLSAGSGHNYLIWPDGTSFGSGIIAC